jgi:hypothetical protein
MRMILAAAFALMVLAAYHTANTPHFRDAWCLAFMCHRPA